MKAILVLGIALVMACSGASVPSVDDAGADASPGDGGVVIFVDAAHSCAPDKGIALGASCSACLTTSCCTAVEACDKEPDCVAFVSCMRDCAKGQSECTASCSSGRDGAKLQNTFSPLFQCATNSCAPDGSVTKGCPI